MKRSIYPDVQSYSVGVLHLTLSIALMRKRVKRYLKLFFPLTTWGLMEYKSLMTINPVTRAIVSIVVAVASLSLSACVSRSKLNIESQVAYDRGFKAADQECINLQLKLRDLVIAMQKDLTQKNQRLLLFNQVDPQGNLYPVSEEYKAPKMFRGPQEKKGDKSWMK